MGFGTQHPLSHVSQIKHLSAGASTGSGSTALASDIIDMSLNGGFESCLFMLTARASSGTAMTLQVQGANATAATDFQDIKDPNTSQAASANSTLVGTAVGRVVAVDVHNVQNFRYLRALVEGATNTTDAFDGIVGMCYKSQNYPTSQMSTDVAASAVVVYPTT